MRRRIAELLRYRRAMRRARCSLYAAINRNGRNWTRSELYERVEER